MIYGLYLSGQGAQAQATQVDVLANNIANASTSGFKRDLAILRAHDPYDAVHGRPDEVPGGLNNQTGGLTVAGVATDFSTSNFSRTGARFDVALRGLGFLTLSDGGNQVLTRDGHLTLNASGILVHQATGSPVLNPDGEPIAIPPDATDVLIGPDGGIQAQLPDGTVEPVGTLNLVRPQAVEELRKIGENLFVADGRLESAAGSAQVFQGFVEDSGTRPILDTVALINASRAFETNMNAIRTQDQTLGALLQSARR